MADETVYRGILSKVRAARMDVQHMMGFLQGTHVEHAKPESESESESEDAPTQGDVCAVRIIVPPQLDVVGGGADGEPTISDRDRLQRFWSAVPREQRPELLREVGGGDRRQVQDTFAVFGDVLASVELEQRKQLARLQELSGAGPGAGARMGGAGPGEGAGVRGAGEGAGVRGQDVAVRRTNPRKMLQALYSANGVGDTAGEAPY